MIRVALVGNIASGKSTVEAMLSNLGYKVLDTDKVCHSLLVEMPEISEAFRCYDVFEKGVISREKLGKLVFKNPLLRKKLENILYPELKKKINDFFENINVEMAFVAIPLLFESGMTEMFDKILFISCDDEIRLSRLIARNSYTREYAQVRMNAQMPQDYKIAHSDFVISNNSTVEELQTAVMNVLEQIR